MTSIPLFNLGLLLLNLRPKRILDLVRPPRLDVSVKHHINLLQRPASSLGVHEEHVDGHGEAEYAEYNICLPLDVVEGWRHEVG